MRGVFGFDTCITWWRFDYIPGWPACDFGIVSTRILVHAANYSLLAREMPRLQKIWSFTYRLHHATRRSEHPESNRGLHFEVTKEAIEVVLFGGLAGEVAARWEWTTSELSSKFGGGESFHAVKPYS